MRKLVVSFFIIYIVTSSSFSVGCQETFNVLDYGAVGDGQNDDSEVSYSFLCIFCFVMIFLLFIINNFIFCLKGFLEGMECFMCSKGGTYTCSTKGENIPSAANKILRSLQIRGLYPC